MEKGAQIFRVHFPKIDPPARELRDGDYHEDLLHEQFHDFCAMKDEIEGFRLLILEHRKIYILLQQRIVPEPGWVDSLGMHDTLGQYVWGINTYVYVYVSIYMFVDIFDKKPYNLRATPTKPNQAPANTTTNSN